MRFAFPLAAIAVFYSFSAAAQTLYPIDRAEILSGARFDFKVEYPGVIDPARISVTINGQDYTKVLGRSAGFLAREDGNDVSSLILRDVSIPRPGTYTVAASDGAAGRSAVWTVYDTPGKRLAKNLILFIGDGLSIGHRTAARILSKGVESGKLKGKLAMDEMPHMALLTTKGTDSIITDSANAAHAYITGHKSCVNALGVYCSRAANSLDHPKVETLTSLAKRKGLAVGVVTNSEIEDATPASMVAHTRRRSDYNDIVGMY